jgi:hypothetical protein
MPGLSCTFSSGRQGPSSPSPAPQRPAGPSLFPRQQRPPDDLSPTLMLVPRRTTGARIHADEASSAELRLELRLAS